MYKILVVDDEKDERDVILFLIKKYNFKLEVFQAANGRDGLEVLKENSIDILLTDIAMPFLNGMELAAEARNIQPEIEILFFSGYDDFEYVKTALSLRAVNYILKPINEDEFSKSISSIINSIEMREASKARSEKYIEEHFHSNSKADNDDNSYYEDAVSLEEDSIIIKNISEAIQLKDIDRLRKNGYFLLDKYSNIPNISHIYIRYLCTTLLQFLINALPGTDDNDLNNAAEEVYKFRYFADIRKYIEAYLEKLIEQMEVDNQSPRHAISMVEQYIHSHINEDLSLSVLADIVFLSPKYLSSMFSQVTGISLNKYIKKVRMEKARELLLTTNIKISDISQEVGYSYVSYFIRIFQEEYNMSPETYRQTRGQG